MTIQELRAQVLGSCTNQQIDKPTKTSFEFSIGARYKYAMRVIPKTLFEKALMHLS